MIDAINLEKAHVESSAGGQILTSMFRNILSKSIAEVQSEHRSFNETDSIFSACSMLQANSRPR